LAGLVEAIQQDALNPKIQVATLLRKVKLAAAKLQLAAVETWVEMELNGYGNLPVPDYRKMIGQPKARNPFRGWIPISGEPEFMAMISEVAPKQSIASLEELTVGKGQIHFPMSSALINTINQGSQIALGEMSVFLDRTQIVGILDAVRNKVLDWSIELEKQGIRGEGLTFDEQERQHAKEFASRINIGSISNFTGNLGQGQSSGSIEAHQIHNDGQVFGQMIEALRTGVSDGGLQKRLIESVQDMERSRSDRASFAVAYGKFMELAANHMSVAAPFLPALLTFLQ
jgi:AbiTii